MTSATELVERMVRHSVADHLAPRQSVTGRDITHHEPVTHVVVTMSLRFAEVFLSNPDKPQAVDGIPLVYAEKPAPGIWDVETMCRYEKNGRELGSRGRLAHGNPDELTP